MKYININNQEEIRAWVMELIINNKLHDFYNSGYWNKVKTEVLKDYKYECQDCKARGYYTKTNTVHHEQFVRKHPSLALSKKYIYNGKEYQNLIPLCNTCHEIRHPDRRKKKEKPLTIERW